MPLDATDVAAEPDRGPRSGAENLAIGALASPDEKFWAGLSDQQRIVFLKDFDTRFQTQLEELYSAADLCVVKYEDLSCGHMRWRRLLIVATSIVAIANLLAANKNVVSSSRIIHAATTALPMIAAILAIILTLLASLESFLNYAERAQAYRESRDMFLDMARELDRLWDTYVRPFGSAPEACLNASELYRRIIASDRDLRGKFKELTKTEKRAAGSQT